MKYISNNLDETQKIAEDFINTLSPKEGMANVVGLYGNLGAGKTTFTQGLLKGLKIKGPYTSPTFAIMKHYQHKTKNIYHIDAYRISSKDLLDLGFADFAGKENSFTIIEWPERVKKIIPSGALWINFEWLSEKERRITISTKK